MIKRQHNASPFILERIFTTTNKVNQKIHMKVYSMIITGYQLVTPCMVILNNFSNTIFIGKFVQVISNQKHPSLVQLN